MNPRTVLASAREIPSGYQRSTGPVTNFHGHKKSTKRLRKNPFRGTTYAAHFGVATHTP